MIDDLPFYDERMERDMLKVIGISHIGISKANMEVWRPSLLIVIEGSLSTFHACANVRLKPTQTLMVVLFPPHPVKAVGPPSIWFLCQGK